MVPKDNRTSLVVTSIAAASTLAVGILGYLGSIRSAEIQAKRNEDQPLRARAETPATPAREEPTSTELEASEQEQRKAIRTATGVELLAELENDMAVGRVSNGRFGFAFDAPLKDQASLADGLRLERSSDNEYRFEIHKTPNGDVVLVGFVDPATVDALGKPEPNARHQVLSQKTQAEQIAVALPMAALVSHDSRRVEPNGVAAALLEFSIPSGATPVATAR